MTLKLSTAALAALTLPALIVSGQSPARADVQADFRNRTVLGDAFVDSFATKGCSVRTNEHKHLAILKCSRTNGFAEVRYHFALPEDAYEIEQPDFDDGGRRSSGGEIRMAIAGPGDVSTYIRLEGAGKVRIYEAVVRYTVNR